MLLDLKTVREKLDKLANDNPNRTAKCEYKKVIFDTKENVMSYAPVCIIGHLLAEIGVDLRLLTEGVNVYGLFKCLPDGNYGLVGPDNRAVFIGPEDAVGMTEEARKYAAKIQKRQDTGLTWFEAVTR
jgi:hypothetical protein